MIYKPLLNDILNYKYIVEKILVVFGHYLVFFNNFYSIISILEKMKSSFVKYSKKEDTLK